MKDSDLDIIEVLGAALLLGLIIGIFLGSIFILRLGIQIYHEPKPRVIFLPATGVVSNERGFIEIIYENLSDTEIAYLITNGQSLTIVNSHNVTIKQILIRTEPNATFGILLLNCTNMHISGWRIEGNPLYGIWLINTNDSSIEYDFAKERINNYIESQLYDIKIEENCNRIDIYPMYPAVYKDNIFAEPITTFWVKLMDAREKACIIVVIATVVLATFTWIYSTERVVQSVHETDPYRILFDDYMDFQLSRLNMHMPSEINSTFHVRVYLLNKTGSLYGVYLANIREYKVVSEAHNITYYSPADLRGYGNGSDYILQIDAYRSFPLGEFEKHLYPAYEVRVVVFSWDLQKLETKTVILVEYPYAEYSPKIVVVGTLIVVAIAFTQKKTKQNTFG